MIFQRTHLYESHSSNIKYKIYVMYFSSFLTFDKKSERLHLTLPPNPQQCHFSGLVQIPHRGVQSLFGKPNKLHLQSQCGILISQQLDSSGSYVLYLQPNLQLDEKYKSFMQRVLVSLCGVIFFGERINYNRMTRKLDSTGLAEQQAYFVTEKDGEADTYKIKSLEDNRLEIGGKVPRDSVKGLACGEQQANRATVAEFLNQLKEYLGDRSNFTNALTMNQVYQEICSNIVMKREINSFRDNIIKTTHNLLTKQQIKGLSQTTYSICGRHTKNQSLIQKNVRQFVSKIQQMNDQFLDQRCQQLTQKFCSMQVSSNSELLDLLQLHSTLLQSQLSPFCASPKSSSLLSKSILLEFFVAKSTHLFNKLTQQLLHECETKRCLTEEMYEQIRVSDDLKLRLKRAENRLEELKNYDEIMMEKTEEGVKLREKVDRLEKEVKGLQGDKGRLEEEVNSMIETLVQNSIEKGRLNQNIREAMGNNDKLLKENKALERKVEKLKQDLALADKIVNKANSDASILKSTNNDLKSAVGHYKNVVGDIQKHMMDLRQADTNKINYIVSLNLKQFQALKKRLTLLESQKLQLTQANTRLRTSNDSYKNQLIYYERLYRLKQSGAPSSNYENKFNQSVSDMIIFEQNDENQTSERLERAHNETFQYRRDNVEEKYVRRSEGNIETNFMKKKIVLKEDWDNSSAKMSEHKFDATLPESIECKSRAF